MKKLLFIVSIIMLFFQHCSLHREESIVIKVKLIEKITYSELDYTEYQNYSFYSCKIELFNNSDTSFYFWTMTCSWYGNWISSSESFRLFNEDCPKNFAKLYKINPKEKLVYNSVICVKDYSDCLKSENKLGFVHIKKDDIYSYSGFDKVLFMKINENKDIIWSEPFTIPQ